MSRSKTITRPTIETAGGGRSDAGLAAGSTWVIFGDDWGAHPSTAQHLARALMPDHRIIWIDSIGMRSLQFSMAEVGEIARKLRNRMSRRPAAAAGGVKAAAPDIRLSVPIVPLHRVALARQVNHVLLSRRLGAALRRLGARNPVLMTSNPVAVHYVDIVEPSAVVYLRQDDYATQPGSEPALIRETEPAMLRRADLVAATARSLVPADHAHTLYLPQGVDLAHFGRVPLAPPRGRVLGFYGLLAEWMDADLIVAAARHRPDWTFEFIGPKVGEPAFLGQAPNIVWRGPVAFERLPEATVGWDAAWLPRRITDFTVAMNPLKLREYLAIGLPTFSTPLPELSAYGPALTVGRDVGDLDVFLRTVVAEDSSDARRARRSAVAGQSWATRARDLIDAVGRVGRVN